MRLIAATLLLLTVRTVTPCLAVYETDGVRLRGYAYAPFSNTGAVRISLRLQNVYDEISVSTSGSSTAVRKPPWAEPARRRRPAASWRRSAGAT
jgi:hypothetical protein